MKYIHHLLTFVVLMLIFAAPAQADVKTKVCEDRDQDGRFGIVQYTIRQPVTKPAIVQPNIGTYNSCLTRKNQLAQCNGNALCTCEDWNNDGRFGVVKNIFPKKSASVLRANIGNYYSCVSYKNTNTRDTADSYHVCEDRDQDGRFGLLKYLLHERMAKPSVIVPNHGNYYSCTTRKNSLNQCKGNNLCSCEDWDKDGRFGVVKYPGVRVGGGRVLSPNVGTYNQCLSGL